MFHIKSYSEIVSLKFTTYHTLRFPLTIHHVIWLPQLRRNKDISLAAMARPQLERRAIVRKLTYLNRPQKPSTQ